MTRSPDQNCDLVAVRLADLQRLVAESTGRFLSIASAARYADLSVESVRRLIAAGKLTALRPVKGKVLVDRRELDSVDPRVD